MVFCILAFIGFESSAPLAEETRDPRRNIPKAVIGACLGVGLFYVLCSYAWVIGTGFPNFTDDTLAQANPWQHLGDVYWSTGWVLIFLAIVNSALANSNAGVNASSRVIFAMGRNGVLPRAFARTHPEHRTPHVAIIAQTVFGVVLALLLGWKWGPLNGFGVISYAATSLVIVVYIRSAWRRSPTTGGRRGPSGTGGCTGSSPPSARSPSCRRSTTSTGRSRRSRSASGTTRQSRRSCSRSWSPPTWR